MSCKKGQQKTTVFSKRNIFGSCKFQCNSVAALSDKNRTVYISERQGCCRKETWNVSHKLSFLSFLFYNEHFIHRDQFIFFVYILCFFVFWFVFHSGFPSSPEKWPVETREGKKKKKKACPSSSKSTLFKFGSNFSF